MSKGIYVGVDDVARKVKQAYVGVEDVARKVKKGYIGVGDVARPFFSSEPTLDYYGAIESGNGSGNAATSVGNYALFAGGIGEDYGGDYYDSNAVTAYDGALIKHTPTALTRPCGGNSAASNGVYAIFSGGMEYAGGDYEPAATDAYDVNLVKTNIARKEQDPYDGASATRLGQFALFALRESFRNTGETLVVAYSKNLSKSTAPSLSTERTCTAAASNEKYAIFAGGSESYTSGYSLRTTVDAYDEQLVRHSAADLPYGAARTRNPYVIATPASLSDRVLIFATDYCGDDATPALTVSSYDTNLVKVDNTLDCIRHAPAKAAVTLNDNVVLVPNDAVVTADSENNPIPAALVFNSSLTLRVCTLPEIAYADSATTAGRYGIFYRYSRRYPSQTSTKVVTFLD